MTLADLDTSYLTRQMALLSALAILPLLGFTFLSPHRRKLIPAALLILGGLTAIGVAICMVSSFGMWRIGPPYGVPARIGPSPFAVRDLVPYYAILVWLPVMLVVASMWWWKQLSSLAVSLALCCFTAMWSGFWHLGALVAFEHSHEDTVWAEAFSSAGWGRIREGMSRAEVEQLIGPPLPPAAQPRFLPGAEFWVSNSSAGYFGCITFREGRVEKKRWWYSD